MLRKFPVIRPSGRALANPKRQKSPQRRQVESPLIVVGKKRIEKIEEDLFAI